MQATFLIPNGNGENIVIRNVTPIHIDSDWELAMEGVLTEEEMTAQIEARLMREFLEVLPHIRQRMQGRNRLVLGDMNDPQAGPPKELSTLKKCEYNGLMSRRYHKTHNEDEFKQNNCVICSDDFKSNNKIPILSCGHSFHWKCLEKWVTQTHNICPICKEIIPLPDPTLS